jgi:hypothetical protein
MPLYGSNLVGSSGTHRLSVLTGSSSENVVMARRVILRLLSLIQGLNLTLWDLVTAFYLCSGSTGATICKPSHLLAAPNLYV